jgi:hypothetical protein
MQAKCSAEFCDLDFGDLELWKWCEDVEEGLKRKDPHSRFGEMPASDQQLVAFANRR